MTPTTHSLIRRVFSLGMGFAGVAHFLVLVCCTATAAEPHVAYLPLIFHAEAKDVRTSGCLQLREHTYDQPRWWENSTESNPPGRAFKEVIAAIQRRDRTTLLKWSDPNQGSDTKHFDEQADAFFQQFATLELAAVPKAYEFDGLAVFFGKFRSQRGFFFAPFVFVREDDGSFGFLPLRTRKVTYQIVNDWFLSTWGPGGGGAAVYCTDSEIKRATHRISLIASEDTQSADRSFLLLRGASVDEGGGLGELTGRVKSRIEEMITALVPGNIDQFVKYLTPEGGGRLKQWFASADSTEQKQYLAAMTGQRPFYVFDLSSVVVVYTRQAAGPVQVMYFTFNANNELVWTNSSHVTVADTIFKTGPLYQASQLSKPFANTVIK